MKKKLFCIIGIMCSCIGYAQTVNTDTIFQKEGGNLGEVVVKGRSYIRQQDRLIIVPNKLDTRHSYTGYDLLYNLMIPGIDVDRTKGTVQVMRGDVTLYINGVKATYRDIQNLKPKEIVKIEYFESPTGKYSGDIASVNYIVKTYKSGGYVALDGTQTLGYLNGDYNFASKLSHGKTSYTLFAGLSTQEYNNKKNHETEVFNFSNDPLTRENQISNEHIEKNQQYAQLNITNQGNSHALQAKLSFVRNAAPNYSQQSLLTYSNTYDNTASASASTNQSIMPSLEFYGGFQLKQNQWMEIRLNGSYTNNRYNHTYQTETFNSLSNVREDLFTFLPQIKYTKSFKNSNTLAAHVMHYYTNSISDYYGSAPSWQHLWTNETLFFISYDWRISPKVSFNNRIGLSYEAYHLSDYDKVTHFSPRFNSTLGWTISPNHQVFLGIDIGNSFPQINTLNAAEQNVDMLHVKRGNPNLDYSRLYTPYIAYNGQINRFKIYGICMIENNINETLPIYKIEEGKVVETYYSSDNFHKAQGRIDLSWRPIDALNIKISGCWGLWMIRGDYDKTLNMVFGVAQINYYWKDFSFNLYGKTKSRKMNEYGIYEWKDAVAKVFVNWSHGNWYAEIGANNFFTRNYKNRIETISDVYDKTCYQYDRTEQQNAYAKLAYSFSFGKKTNREKKEVNTEINSAILKAQ